MAPAKAPQESEENKRPRRANRIRFYCSACGKQLNAIPELVGAAAKCPNCDSCIVIQSLPIAPVFTAESTREDALPVKPNFASGKWIGIAGIILLLFLLMTIPKTRQSKPHLPDYVILAISKGGNGVVTGAVAIPSFSQATGIRHRKNAGRAIAKKEGMDVIAIFTSKRAMELSANWESSEKAEKTPPPENVLAGHLGYVDAGNAGSNGRFRYYYESQHPARPRKTQRQSGTSDEVIQQVIELIVNEKNNQKEE